MDTQRRTERIVVKTLIFFAILFGISLGTCGLSVSVQYGPSVETLAWLSLIGMALGLLGMALSDRYGAWIARHGALQSDLAYPRNPEQT